MHVRREERPGSLAQLGAVATLAVRYATTMHRDLERELRHWRRRAAALDDAARRKHALTKHRDAAVHARLNATPAAFCPRRRRRDVVAASVALEVLYDHLDTLTEQERALEPALALYRVLEVPFADRADDTIGDDYIRELALRCRAGFRALPAHATVAPIALAVASRCAAAQARCHTCSSLEFERWTRRQPRATGLEWWEAAAGWSAEVMTLHALIALAGSDGCSAATCRRVIGAYGRIDATATLLDSFIDQRQDERERSHNYVAYYPSRAVAAERIAVVAADAMADAASLPHPHRHALILLGVAAYYLTDPAAAGETGMTSRLRRELGPSFDVLRASFRLLRLFRRLFPPTSG